MTQRSFLSPAVAFTFVPVALTGLLLLFHLKAPGVKDIHEWVGLAFTVFCVFHIAVNWKPFEKYLGKVDARVALAMAVVLTVACGMLGIFSDDPGHGPMRAKHAVAGKQFP